MYCRLLTLALIAVLMTASTALAQGAQVIVTPRLGYRIGWTDNVNSTKESDLIHRGRAELQLDVNTERSKNRVLARVDGFKLHDHDELDRLEQEYTLSSTNDLTERLRLIANASYEADYTIGKIDDETGERANKTPRNRLSASPRLEYMLTEVDMVGVDYNYGWTTYEGDQYTDTENQGTGVDWTHFWNERFRTFVRTGWAWNTLDYGDGGTGTHKAWNYLAGFEWDINEIWTINLRGGGSKSSTVVDRPGLDASRSGDGILLSGKLSWEYERSAGYIEYSRDSSFSLSGSNQTRDRLTIQELYEFDERTRLRLRGSRTATEADGFQSSSKNQFYAATAELDYDITEHFLWRTGYGVRYRINNSGTSNAKNILYMEWVWELPEEF